MTGTGNAAQGDGQQPKVGMLRQGFWNYTMDRWAPKNQTGRLMFEIGILVVFFLVLAVLPFSRRADSPRPRATARW